MNWLKQEVALLKGKEVSEEDIVRQSSQRQYTPETLEENDDSPEKIGNVDVDLKNPLIEDKAWFVTDSASWQPIYIGEAACTAFGTRLRQFLNGNEPVAPLSRSKYSKHKAFLRMAAPAPRFEWPNRAYAHLLLKVALRFLGNDYHLMLRKSTIDRMQAIYDTQKLDDPVFVCKLFALFSMGEMYSNRRLGSTKGPDVPGTGYFVQAMSLTQDIHEEASVVYVEALLIIVSCFLIGHVSRCSILTIRGKTVSVFAGTQQNQICIYLRRDGPPSLPYSRSTSQCPRRLHNLCR